MEAFRRLLAALFRSLARQCDRPLLIRDLYVIPVGGGVVLSTVKVGMPPIQMDPGEAVYLAKLLRRAAHCAGSLDTIRAAGVGVFDILNSTTNGTAVN